MRIRLHTNDYELTGYVNHKIDNNFNVDILESLGYDDGELDELLLDEVIDYLPLQTVESLIAKMSNKLTKGGKLIITGIDLQEVCKSVANYAIDIPTANRILYGNFELRKMNSFSASSMSEFLKLVLGIKIMKKRLNGYSFMIEGVRQ